MTEPLTPTPTPWFCENDGIYNAARSYLITPTGDSDQDRADAAHIVAAVNEIDSLRAARIRAEEERDKWEKNARASFVSLSGMRGTRYIPQLPKTDTEQGDAPDRWSRLVDRAEAAEERALRAEEERDEARAKADEYLCEHHDLQVGWSNAVERAKTAEARLARAEEALQRHEHFVEVVRRKGVGCQDDEFQSARAAIQPRSQARKPKIVPETATLPAGKQGVRSESEPGRQPAPDYCDRRPTLRTPSRKPSSAEQLRIAKDDMRSALLVICRAWDAAHDAAAARGFTRSGITAIGEVRPDPGDPLHTRQSAILNAKPSAFGDQTGNAALQPEFADDWIRRARSNLVLIARLSDERIAWRGQFHPPQLEAGTHPLRSGSDRHVAGQLRIPTGSGVRVG